MPTLATPADRPDMFARRAVAALAMAAALAAPAWSGGALRAQTVGIDAVRQPPAPDTGFLRMGTNVAPGGHVIGVNGRYLTRDGRPWLPVMGEFHYSRYPADEWEDELLKMKAAGVEIVSTYIIWIHHEEVEGEFDWSGQRDLRAFAELCAKHGLLLYPRIGPWSHAEVRNGGFPDWLVRKVGPGLRSDDSTYLSYVARFYDQIGRQLHGLLWKDGGPVIGIQLENEYNARGPGRGAEHILRLKQLALAAGFDVPLYTVTGWDNAVLPPAEVIPVFGGYPDWPWDQSIEQLPPNEVYAFRFDNRWSGDRDARSPAGTSQDSLARYPFLGAEFGGAIEDTYHRRPVISADDIAAMLPVQLGSGINLYGYYLFHGGANPAGKLSTLQESQRTGYPTDVPTVSYDFQAPLGEYGQVRESYRRIKLVHYFLNAFGDRLAPMVVRRPDRVPPSAADTTTPRVSARTLGERGFIFLDNYVRHYPMPARRAFQVELRLPHGRLAVPARPIDVPSGAYFIWPVNFDLGGPQLTYATAQLVTRVGTGDSAVYVFFAVPGVTPEFAFDARSVRSVEAPGATIARRAGRIYVRCARPGTGVAIALRRKAGTAARIVLLSRDEAENLWRGELDGAARLVLSAQDAFFEGGRVHLRARGTPEFSAAVYPAPPDAAGLAPLRRVGPEGLFTRYVAALPMRDLPVVVDSVRAADSMPPVPLFNAVTWRHVAIALAPSDSAWDSAAVWRVQLPDGAVRGLDNVFLEIRYEGDVARLYSGTRLLDDNFYNGQPWRVGLHRFEDALRRGPLELRILPLRSAAPIYLETTARPTDFDEKGQVARLESVRAIARYEVVAGGAPAEGAPR